ncbi:hypothetical protein [Azospirillum sp. TSO5]|uniref:hypothetical protein n=1 Tax=Azospirillum sp. TSO5 TaxID=716760 RepID=UPI000D64D68C|nr:hypothetical protein [Azospirillum sp. TSO5]
MDDIWDGIKGILATVAPGIATALGGPLAGAAVASIVGALGLPADAPPEDIAAAVKRAGPQELLAIKQAEQQFLTDMRKLDIDVTRLGNEDRANARARQVALNDHAPALIGGGVLLVWAGVQAYVMSHGLPPGLPEAVATRVLGMLDAAALGVIYYFFGSSNQRPEPKRGS